MAQSLSLFSTPVRRAAFKDAASLNSEIEAAALSFTADDELGRRWSVEHGYPGYTSYGSIPDLVTRAPCFAALKTRLDSEAASFAKELAFDLGRARLKLDNIWINVMPKGAFHSGHIHPHSVISGTYYVRAPKGAAAIRFEDPRLSMMMAAPPRCDDAPEALKPFVYVAPEEGTALLWESWLRHEVVRNASSRPRISVSFNYRWG
ncbi:MAG: TIGR02466 family protein [Parvularculaceae bacterium]|nr:TIGR02466 family protein [Parvularculaceae bacterium]